MIPYQQARARTETDSIAATIRLARWIVAGFALAMFGLYEAPDGVTPPFNVPLVGVVVACAIAATNFVSHLGSSSDDRETSTRLTLASVVMDVIVASGVLWLFAFDHTTTAMWGILTMPLISAAVRFRITGAIAVWAVVSPMYVLRQTFTSRHYTHAGLNLDDYAFRFGILLFVGMATGAISKVLLEEVRAHREARREAEVRAGLLRTVANAGQSLTVGKVDEILETVVASAIGLGFEGAAIAMLDASGGYTLQHAAGALTDAQGASFSSRVGVVAKACERRQAVVVHDYSKWAGSVPHPKNSGLRIAVGVQIRAGDELAAVLVGCTRSRDHIGAAELESFDLLATQAGATLSVARQLADGKERQAKLEHDALHDPLTGLPNRTLLVDRLEHALERKVDSGDPVAVLFLDLDGFKEVNDLYGHEVGDEVLRLVAERLRRSVRAVDTIARIGGDEFTVLVEDPPNEEHVRKLATRLVRALRGPLSVDEHEVGFSVSVGVTYSSAAPGSSSLLLRKADRAMYTAKERGGARWTGTRQATLRSVSTDSA